MLPFFVACNPITTFHALAAGVFTHCSAVIIKPHAVQAAAAGDVIDTLLKAEVEISAIRTIVLSRKDVTDYLEAYRGVYPEYERWVTELSSGPAVVMEVRGDDVVNHVRELTGPYNPEIARVLWPSSLRAKLGVDAVRNAVHVTDISNDGPLECKFLFDILE